MFDPNDEQRDSNQLPPGAKSPPDSAPGPLYAGGRRPQGWTNFSMSS